MRGTITLAEAATAHPDGTVSMLRSGINRCWSEELPVTISAALVVQIGSEMSELGPHDLVIRCMDADGADVLPIIKIQFGIPKGGGQNSVIVPLMAPWKEYGRYTFSVSVDKLELAIWTVSVLKKGEDK